MLLHTTIDVMLHKPLMKIFPENLPGISFQPLQVIFYSSAKLEHSNEINFMTPNENGCMCSQKIPDLF